MLSTKSVLQGLTLQRVPPAVFEAASRLDPPELRSVDVIHIAAALELGDDLEASSPTTHASMPPPPPMASP